MPERPGSIRSSTTASKSPLERQALALDPVERRLDGKALGLQPALHEIDDSRLVLDQQDARRRL